MPAKRTSPTEKDRAERIVEEAPEDLEDFAWAFDMGAGPKKAPKPIAESDDSPPSRKSKKDPP
jgi:hypothetical protein